VKKQTSRVLRQNNAKLVLSFLRRSGPTSIPTISSKTKLSNNTIAMIIQQYLSTGIVVHSGKAESSRNAGKRPNLYVFNPRSRFAIGVNVSEFSIDGVITDLQAEILKEISVPISDDIKTEEILKEISAIADSLLKNIGVERERLVGVAIGTHGITDFRNGVVVMSPRNPAWNRNFHLKEQIQNSFHPGVPIYVDNQIRFQAIAEKKHGLGKKTKNMIVLRCTDGIIAGVFSENSLRRGGKHFLIGHIGHMIVDPNSQEICKCGSRGCLDSLISTRRVIRDAKRRYNEHPDSMIFKGKTTDSVTIEDIFKASNNGDLLSQELLDEVIQWLSIGIHNLILTYDPDLIVIQGSFASAGSYFIEKLRRKVNRVSLFEIRIESEIEYSLLGKRAGTIGAATFVINEFFKSYHLCNT